MLKHLVCLTLLTTLTWAAAAPVTSLYSLTVKSLDGQPVPLAQYRGKVCLVVNTASECGYTPQYEGLQKLNDRYAAQGFVVLGFPSNDFGGQEPGSAEQIRTFCTATFHVTFPLFEKVSVRPGPDQSPVYAFLTAGGKTPSWNFCKYLVDKQGRVLGYYPSGVKPDDEELSQAIQTALGGPVSVDPVRRPAPGRPPACAQDPELQCAPTSEFYRWSRAENS